MYTNSSITKKYTYDISFKTQGKIRTIENVVYLGRRSNVLIFGEELFGGEIKKFNLSKKKIVKIYDIEASKYIYKPSELIEYDPTSFTASSSSTSSLGVQYMNENRSGIDFNTYTITELDAYVSFLLENTIEIGVAYHTANTEYENSNFSDSNMEGKGYSLGSAFYIRPSDRIGIRLSVGYYVLSYDGNYFDAYADICGYDCLDISQTGTSFSYGGFAKVYNSKKLSIIPFFNYYMTNTEVEESIGNQSVTITDDWGTLSYGIGIRMGNIAIEPTVFRNEDEEQVYSINFKMIINQ